MTSGLDLEVVLASLYAVFLAGVAFALESLARHSHRRSERYRTSGFVYDRDLNQWECPAGRQLVQVDKDLQRGIVRYRADANWCNSCSLKLNCTYSDEGRVLETRLASWFESELRRFHRVLSLALLLLAAIMLAAEAFRHTRPNELVLLLSLLLGTAISIVRLCASLRMKYDAIQPPGML